jgi:MinD superfamily P-loop ATPase
VKELVVISGKGGTGKTSIVASFAALVPGVVTADCDVDAADLHLVLSPVVKRREPFVAGYTAVVRDDACRACDRCREVCRFDAVRTEERTNGRRGPRYTIDPIACEGCGVCVHFCPENAVDLVDTVCGEWFVSDGRHGPLVHARLGAAQENSGKLVTKVRTEAMRIARESGAALVLVDGPPGIGCPVIASVTGADLALIITEPTKAGLHDLGRAVELCRGLGARPAVCVNKYDINIEAARGVEDWCEARGLPVTGRIPYDDTFTSSQLLGLSVVEHSHGPTAAAIIDLWRLTSETLGL